MQNHKKSPSMAPTIVSKVFMLNLISIQNPTVATVSVPVNHDETSCSRHVTILAKS